MFDFGPLSSREEEERLLESKPKLDIGDVLKNIDEGNESWFGTLSPEEQKAFAPYVVQRWFSSLDDSVLVTYPSKGIETELGMKWNDGAKDMLNQIREQFNESTEHTCSTVQKYEHAKYNWRMKFSLSSQAGATAFMEFISEFGLCTRGSMISSMDSTDLKLHLSSLNTTTNKHMFDMPDHPELLYRTMCTLSNMMGTYKAGGHSWIPFPKGKRNVNKQVYAVFQLEETANLNVDEYTILLRGTSETEFDAIMQGQAIDDSPRKALMKLFKAEKDKFK